MESRSGCWAWPWHPGLLPASRKRGAWGCRDALLGLGAPGALAAWRGLRALPWSWPLMLFRRGRLVPFASTVKSERRPSDGVEGAALVQAVAGFCNTGVCRQGSPGLAGVKPALGPHPGLAAGWGGTHSGSLLAWCGAAADFCTPAFGRVSRQQSVPQSLCLSRVGGQGRRSPVVQGPAARPGSGVCRQLSQPVLCRQPRCSPWAFWGSYDPRGTRVSGALRPTGQIGGAHPHPC